MNKIYKVIWNNAKRCYVVVSEFAKSKGKERGSRSKGVFGTAFLCALMLTSSMLLMDPVEALVQGGSAENEATMKGQYVALYIGPNKPSAMTAQFSDPLGNVYNYTAMQVTGGKQEWYYVRNGFTIEAEEDYRHALSATPNLIRTYQIDPSPGVSAGLLSDHQVLISYAGVTTLNDKSLNKGEAWAYAGGVNSSAYRPLSDSGYVMEIDGKWVGDTWDTATGKLIPTLFNNHFKEVTLDTQTNTYRLNGKVVSNDALYAIRHWNNNKNAWEVLLGVFTTDTAGKEVYRGKIFGFNNEVLMTAKAENGKYYSYWATEVVDPNSKLGESLTLYQFNNIINELKENDLKLHEDDLKKIDLAPMTGGGTIALDTNGGADVPGTIQVTSTGGTNGSDLNVHFENRAVVKEQYVDGSGKLKFREVVTTGAFDIPVGSVVVPNGGATYASGAELSTLKVNGQEYKVPKTHFYSVNGGVASDGNYDNAGATGLKALAAGIGASATTANATAIGTGASATANSGDVALGSGSATATVVKTTQATIGGKSYSAFAGTAPNSTVSVGSLNAERTITNVAAGRIEANSTDAINGSQLYSVASGLAGDISTINNTLTAGTFTVSANNEPVDRIAKNENIKFVDDADNIKVTYDASTNTFKHSLGQDLAVGKAGVNGKDGKIGVAGKDGSAVVINGKDGSIGLNGANGTNGISIKGGDGKPGVDGTNITRLVIEEKDGTKHDVATLDDGMKYGGDVGAGGDANKKVIKKKLNGQVNVVGGVTDEAQLTTENNIGVISDGTDNLTLRLAKELKGLTSVTTGDTTMSTNGIVIKNGTGAGDANGDKTVSLTKAGLNNGGNKITNVATGVDDTDAVNVGQLNSTIAANKTVLVAGKNTTVDGVGTAANPYKVNVADDITLGKAGADGKDGKIGVAGKDGSAVVINGKDGSIGLNGANGTNGISIKGGDGKPGVDGTNITRLVIEEKDGTKHDVATLDDGMKYGGDVGVGGDANKKVIKKKLNGQVNVVGGVTDEAQLTTENNIGVISDGTDNLTLRLAKELKGLTSVTTGDTTMSTNGIVIKNGTGAGDANGDKTVSLTKAGLNNGGNKIINVAPGTNPTDAVNYSQLTSTVASGKTKLVAGKNTTVEGDGTQTDPYKVNVADDITLGEAGANGKDGKIGVAGKDGSAVVINGKDGSIGLNGANGANGISIKGGDGKPGVDGTNITRLVIEEKDGTKYDVATLDDGMKYGGDVGAGGDANKKVIKKKLNGQVNIVGGITDEAQLSTENNLGVVSDGSNNLTLRLAKELKGLTSVTTGDTTMSTNGIVIKNGTGAGDANGDKTVSLTKAGLNNGGNKITNVATGVDDTDAVNVGQLNSTIAANKTVLVAGKNTTVDGVGTAANPYKVNVADDITLGKAGADGKDGKIGVAGKDGSAVVINGKDGSIGLNGANGTNGISIKGGDGKPGVDGTNITRLVIEEKDGTKHDVATLDDGMKYGGDVGAGGDASKKVIKKKLNEQVNIVGGVTDEAQLSTENNLGVVSDGSNNLTLRLAKELKGLTSVTTGDTTMNSDGLTIKNGTGAGDANGDKTVSLTKAGLNNGGNKITNVATGVDDTDAVNVGQLNSTIAANKTVLVAGKNTTVDGEGTAANPYKVNVADDITLGEAGANGKDGKIGVAGKDGSAVVINGKDGSIGLNGANGTNGISIKGGDGKPGVDGTNITRLVIEEKDGTKHDVATLDDGMKYGGDVGVGGDANKKVIKKKLNGQVNVVGGITDEAQLSTENNLGVVSDGENNLTLRLAKELKGLTSVTTGDTTMNSDGLTIKNGTGAGDANGDKTVSLTKEGLNNGGNKITNVAAGVADTDAVNVKQLKDLDDLNVKYTDKTYGKVVMKGDPSTDGGVTGGTTITNVHQGELSPTSTDAVNGAQLYKTNQAVEEVAGRIGQLGQSVNQTGAHAAAMSALKPLAYDPIEPTQIMAGVGTYHGESALAIGVAHYTREDTMFHIGASIGGHGNMVNAGITHKFGSSDERKMIPDRYKAGPVSSIYVMQDEVSALKAENAQLKKENEETKAQLAMIMNALGLAK